MQDNQDKNNQVRTNFKQSTRENRKKLVQALRYKVAGSIPNGLFEVFQ
jgi:ribosome recycling factor